MINTCNLNHYRIYKKLVLHGLRLMRHSAMILKNNKGIEKIISTQGHKEKRKSDEDILEPSKRHCSESSTKVISSKYQQTVCKHIFEILQKNAPQVYNSPLNSSVPDYCIFMPNNKNRSTYDLKLDIWYVFIRSLFTLIFLLHNLKNKLLKYNTYHFISVKVN